jgi:hypothetical protein
MSWEDSFTDDLFQILNDRILQKDIEVMGAQKRVKQDLEVAKRSFRSFISLLEEGLKNNAKERALSFFEIDSKDPRWPESFGNFLVAAAMECRSQDLIKDVQMDLFKEIEKAWKAKHPRLFITLDREHLSIKVHMFPNPTKI